MTKLKVSIKEGSFPVRYNGERYSVGEEFVIDEKHFNTNSMNEIEKVEEKKQQDDEFEGKTVDELKAYAEEHQIDIGNATSENGIIKKIKEAREKVEE